MAGRPAKPADERPVALSIYPDLETREEIKRIASEEERPVAKVAVMLIKDGLAARDKARS